MTRRANAAAGKSKKLPKKNVDALEAELGEELAKATEEADNTRDAAGKSNCIFFCLYL